MQYNGLNVQCNVIYQFGKKLSSLRGLLVGVHISDTDARHQQRIGRGTQYLLVLVSFLCDLEC